MIPVAFPTFYQHFGADVQTIVGSGITMGSLSAIILNLAFNVLGGASETAARSPTAAGRLSIEDVNALERRGVRARRSRRCSRARCRSPPRWPRGARSTRSTSMRHAFHSVLFDEDDESDATR